MERLHKLPRPLTPHVALIHDPLQCTQMAMHVLSLGPSSPLGVWSDPACTVSGRLFLENSQLEHSEDESSVLGQGGSGTVIYRARYQGQPVAVKRFQIKKFKNFANAPAGEHTGPCVAPF